MSSLNMSLTLFGRIIGVNIMVLDTMGYGKAGNTRGLSQSYVSKDSPCIQRRLNFLIRLST